MRIISLGWGVQSFALAAMSALGELPKVDAVIHADTTHERSETYEFAQRWTPWLEERGVRVVTVQGGRPVIGTNAPSYTSIPAFTAWAEDVIWCPKFVCADCGEYAEDMSPCEHCGSFRVVLRSIYEQKEPQPFYVHRAGDPSGMLRRQCTHDWKIMPIRRWLRANDHTSNVEQWLGITLDEIQRMRQSDVKYITIAYPLIEYLNRSWTRGMVVQWLRDNGLEVPVKSSCVFCPYHDRATWREIKLSSNNGDWEKAVAVDKAIRHKRPGYLCYLTAERKPLTECNFRNLEDLGQMRLDEVCGGECWL